MYKREFEQLIQNNNLPKALLLHGECNYQNNYFAQKITELWCKDEDEKLLLHYDEYDFT